MGLARDVKTALRRLRKRKGFYTSYRYIESAPWTVERYDEIGAIFARDNNEVQKHLADIASLENRFVASLEGPNALPWGNEWVPPLDSAAMYAMVSCRRPSRIVEIGSGNTTHFMARAISDSGQSTEFICIDPEPRKDIEALRLRHERRVLSYGDHALIDSLGAGDILFVDSSHILQPGFDLDIVLNRLIPRLNTGVIVHFHDIFLPYAYPAQWERRRYNEQNAIALLLFGGAFRLLFSSMYAAVDHADAVKALCPRFPLIAASQGGSIWLTKTAPPFRPMRTAHSK